MSPLPSWVGAVTDGGVSVAARMTVAASDVTLRVIGPSGNHVSSEHATDADNCVRIDVEGLEPDTAYAYELRSAGLVHATGSFHTFPEAGEPASFTVAFAGDANTGSNHEVFDTIRNSVPLMFVQLGDFHYRNISTDSPEQFHAAYDQILATSRPSALLRNVPTAYVWDDHDFGANNSNGASASKPAAASVYRQRVPHYPLPHATAVYQTWDIGRVRFIMTDQRSEASANSATNNSSKSMLGTEQKAWFKDLLANSPGMLIVWICPRVFQAPSSSNSDNWGGFSTERAELSDHIQANCSGRVIVVSADLHTGSIDDGSNTDYATSGSEPLVTLQAAPLDRSDRGSGGLTYSHGEYQTNGQWGAMQVTDSGGESIDVTLRLHSSTGAILTAYAFSVAV